MAPPRIFVVGSVNTDMVVVGQRIPAPGETVTGGRFVLAAGGKGANQAVAAARLGARVTLVAKVGNDLFGRESIDRFAQEGIRTEHVLRDSAQATGVALILVDAAGENAISVAPGANFALAPEDVEPALAELGPGDVVLLQLEIPLPTVAHAARLASAAGARVILDPAPAAPLDDAILRHVDCLTPNETEASRLTGIEVRDVASARAAAERLLADGAKSVIVTLGGAGSLVCQGDRCDHVPCPRVDAIDTTAAGDAFNGGLAFAWSSGKSLADAAAFATRVGALAVTKLGAQPSLPTAEDVSRFAPA
ncbi:MAG: ribokinase [Pirellulales bacterium]|nr:ribokinase [Pirellulales bacterium]